MGVYTIVDEPKIKPWGHFILNPIAIFFISIFLPIFWNPPFQGRIWMPMLWLMLNGYMLGSPTLRKEILILIVGGLLYISLPTLYVATLASTPVSEDPLLEYVRLLIRCVFFFSLYMVVFLQSTPYGIYEYIKERQSQ